MNENAATCDFHVEFNLVIADRTLDDEALDATNLLGADNLKRHIVQVGTVRRCINPTVSDTDRKIAWVKRLGSQPPTNQSNKQHEEK